LLAFGSRASGGFLACAIAGDFSLAEDLLFGLKVTVGGRFLRCFEASHETTPW
jgi:hypothetical protein